MSPISDILQILGIIYVAMTILSHALIMIANLTAWNWDDKAALKVAEYLKKIALFAARFGIDIVKRTEKSDENTKTEGNPADNKEP